MPVEELQVECMLGIADGRQPRAEEDRIGAGEIAQGVSLVRQRLAPGRKPELDRGHDDAGGGQHADQLGSGRVARADLVFMLAAARSGRYQPAGFSLWDTAKGVPGAGAMRSTVCPIAARTSRAS